MARKAKKPPVTVRTKLAVPESDSEEEMLEYLRTLERVRAYKVARDDLLTFAKLMMPSPDDPDNPNKSQYQVAPHHALMAHALHKIERGELPRLIITLPPRHGKSQLVSKLFYAWYMGRNPYNSAALATYNSDFAGDFGRDVRAFIQSEVFRSIFPEFELRKGSAASDRMTTVEGGSVVFVGAGGALTGRGFHMGGIDDPFKDSEEADSPVIRNKRWDWFVKVFMTRQMDVGSSVIITLTRWHEDDIVGRLTDPENPHYDPEEASQWKVINLPFFADVDDPLKRKPGEVLWPEKFSKEFGEAQRRLSPRAFEALYQQKPTVADGVYFKKQWFQYYEDAPRRENLEVYIASDHAVATAQHNDKTAMVVAGVDSKGDIYILDCVWGRFDTHQQVEHIIALMKKWKPNYWWAEDEQITKSIGPFLRKKKMEAGVSCVVEGCRASKDKETRGRSGQGLMADMRVWWPRRAWWRLSAEEEMLKFPQGTFDDFTDAFNWLAMKIQQMYAKRKAPVEDKPNRKTFGWWKKQEAFEQGLANGQRLSGGW